MKTIPSTQFQKNHVENENVLKILSYNKIISGVEAIALARITFLKLQDRAWGHNCAQAPDRGESK